MQKNRPEVRAIKIIIEELPEGEEEQIILRCQAIDHELMQLINSIKSGKNYLIAYTGDEIHRLSPDEAYYFESVDNKVFLYSKEAVFETKFRLYELEQMLGQRNFLRVSKSVLLNLAVISRLKPAFSGRLEAVLDNNEKVIISRQYVPLLKEKFGL